MGYTECKYCNHNGAGNYCQQCGEPYHQHRITVGHMLHEVVHLFTHFDKGFLYTLKRLITSPGIMQKEYINGTRKNYQKPFSMYFVCGTITALAVYWISKGMEHFYKADNVEETHFFQHYFVLTQMCVVPLYAAVNWLAYSRSKYNYAEFLVLLLYNISALFLLTILTNLVKLIVGEFETEYIEMGIVVMYNIITYINFFNEGNRIVVILKTLVTSALCFTIARYAMLFVIKVILKH